MNAVIFRLLFVNFDITTYNQVNGLLGKIQTFSCQRSLWSQDKVADRAPTLPPLPPQGYDAYLINGCLTDDQRSRQDSEMPSWRENNWTAGLSPAPVIVLVETRADGLAALAAGAADYLLPQELTVPVLERSLRLTIACSQPQPDHQQQTEAENRAENRAENQRASHDLAQQMTDCLPQLIYIYDLKNGQNIYTNQQITQMLGYSQQEVNQGGLKFWQNLVHADDWFVFKQLLSDRYLILADGEVAETEYRVRHQNGSWHWLSCRDVIFTRDEDGIPEQILGTAIDVTNHKLISQQLKKDEAQLYNVFTNTTEGILVVDPKGIVRFANPAAVKLFDQPLEDLLEAQLQWPMVVGETAELEIVQSSGQLRIGEMLVAQTELPGESVYVVSLRDITDRRLAEQALRESEQRFRQLAENIEDVFWLFTSVPMKMLYVSPAYERIWGRTCESLYEDPLNIFQNIHPEDIDRFTINWQKQGRGESTSLEYRITRPDGGVRWIYDRAFPVKNNRGKVVRVAGISEDITQRKQTSEEMQAVHKQLEFHLENSPLAFIEWNEDFRVSQWSGSAEKIFGWSAAEAIGKRYDEWGFIYEHNCEMFAEFINLTIRKKQSIRGFETRNLTKSGSDIYCQWYNSILLDDRGRVLSLFSLVLNVSDRRRAELALRESEERFRAIFEQAAVGMSLCSLDGRFYRVNQKLCDIVGYSREELLQRTFKDITVIQDRRENQKYVSQLLSGEIPNYSIEKRYVSRTGATIWVNVMVSLMRNRNSQPNYFIFVVENISDRKRYEIEIANSEERFRVIFEQAAVGIFRRTIYGEYLQVNQRFCQIVGYTEAELIGRTFQNLIHPDDREEHLAYLQQILAKQIHSYHLEQRYIHKNGRQKWVKIAVSVAYETGESPQYLIGIVEDIQDRKNTEGKLQYRLALETAVAQVSRQLANSHRTDIQDVLKTIGIAVGANRVFLNCFSNKCQKVAIIADCCNRNDRYNIEEIKNIELEKYYWFIQQLRHHQNIVVTNTDMLPNSAIAEKKYLKSIGVKSVLAVPIFSSSIVAETKPNSVDNLWGSIGLSSDETDKHWSSEDAQMLRIVGGMIYSYYSRAQAEAELRDSEALYAGIFDHSAESIFLLSIQPDGELIYQTINPTNEQLFQVTREQLLGKRLSEVRSPQLTSAFLQHSEKCLERKNPINYEETILLPQGNCHLLTTLVPIFDSTGKIVKLQGSSRDITAQKQVEAALQEAKEAADAANRAKSIFLANMSHELRTPLNAILGFTQLLTRDSNITSEQREQMGIIMRSGEHLLSLINDILDLSKIEAGRIVRNLESFNLFQMLDTLYDMLQVPAAAKGLELQITHADNVPKYIKTDRNKLRQILINLLGNAIKFTQFGRVALQVKTLPGTSEVDDDYSESTPDGQIPDRQIPDRLIFEIADTGSGIAPKELETLFDAFVQSQSGKKSQEGTGLGLAISQQFVKLMGGAIAVRSTLGKGSIFSFDIQLQSIEPDEFEDLLDRGEIEPSGAAPVVLGLAPGQPQYRILVVEDVRSSRQLLVKLLEQVGFEVREASDGQEAVSLWHSWQPHLIFMDIRMPVMDGFQATKAIRASINGEAPAIIALTASAFESEREAISSIGCDDFIPKPFSESLLLEKIAFHLGVSYIYQESPSIASVQPALPQREISPEDLAVMSDKWIGQLNLAALSARSKNIQALIQEIPPEHQVLIQGLTKLIQNLDFDTIVSLSEVNQP